MPQPQEPFQINVHAQSAALSDQLSFYRPTLIAVSAAGSMSLFGNSIGQRLAGAAVGGLLGFGVVLWMNSRLKKTLEG